jgi:uncharacterized protein YdaT
MGAFSELDLMIQEKSNYNSETRENESTYLQLRDEINEHIQGRIAYKDLNPIAQEVVSNWESIMEESNSRYFEEENGEQF